MWLLRRQVTRIARISRASSLFWNHIIYDPRRLSPAEFYETGQHCWCSCWRNRQRSLGGQSRSWWSFSYVNWFRFDCERRCCNALTETSGRDLKLALERDRMQILFTWTCVLPSVISSGKRAWRATFPARFAGMQLAESVSGRDRGSRGIALSLSPETSSFRTTEGCFMPAVVGYLYVTYERPCEIASHDDASSLPRANPSLVYAYVRQR